MLKADTSSNGELFNTAPPYFPQAKEGHWFSQGQLPKGRQLLLFTLKNLTWHLHWPK